MAKEKEKRIARILFVEQNKEAKTISDLIGVSEQTLSKWVNLGNWREERNARLANPSVRIDNIRQIINGMSEERIELTNRIKQAELQGDLKEASTLRSQVAHIDDAVAKWNKTIATVNKESQITLSNYLVVMEMIFEDLRKFDEKLFLKTIDFQERHINDVSLRFK
jgi:hypothetical protein